MNLQLRSLPSHAVDSEVSTPAPLSPATGANRATNATEFALITERAAFDALEDDWNALFARAGRSDQVFQAFNWNWHWANHYLGSSPGGIAGLRLSIVTARRDGQLILVWPLVCERVHGVTQVFWMGDPVSQYGDVLIDDLPDRNAVLSAAWEYLKANARADVVRLRRVREDASVAELLPGIGARVAEHLTAPYIDLASASDFAHYEARYSSHARKNRRRLMRRLEERGPVTFERHYGGAAARALAITALQLKAEWLNSRGLISHAISDERMSRFFADAAEGIDKSTNCIVSTLKSNGEPAALEVSFTCKGRLAMHVIVYNLKFEKSSAGVLLMERCLADGYKDGLAVYDMLAPGDNYKLDWADATANVRDWVAPLTVKGHAYAKLYLGFLRPKAKALLAGMSPKLRKFIKRAVKS